MIISGESIHTYSTSEISSKNPRFGKILSTVLQVAEDCEFKALNKKWALTGNEQILIGTLDINPKMMQGPSLKELGYFTLSFRVSSNTKYALAFLSGVKAGILDDNTYVCLGESCERKRATSSLHIEDAVEQAFNRFIRFSDVAQELIDVLKARKISQDAGLAFIVKVAYKGLIPYRSVEYVSKEWMLCKETRSWNLLQCFENAWNKLGACDRFDFFKDFVPFMDENFKLEIPSC